MTGQSNTPSITPFLELVDATVVLGGARVLDALTITIPLRQHTAILGPNGAGKSTFMKLLTGELGLPKDRLNFSPGTPEILNWIAAAGAMKEAPMKLIDYVPCYRSPASTGHGVTFGYWE